MLKEYYYDKYSILFSWDTNSKNAIATKTLYRSDYDSYGSKDTPYGSYDDYLWDNAETESCALDQASGSWVCMPIDRYKYLYYEPNLEKDYRLVENNFNGLPNYEYELYNKVPDNIFIAGKLLDDNKGIIIYGYGRGIYDTTYHRWYVKQELVEARFLQSYKAYKHHAKGDLLEEDLIRNETYPVNGVKDGFWWVRGIEYTIPPPTLVEPENAFIVNVEEGEVIPHLVFRLNKRHADESSSLKYHARLRVARESDFVEELFKVESKNDQTGWEYYDGSAWVQFPSTGVVGDTLVRYQPVIADLEFGFYYWSATAWHNFWKYGIEANPRMIIVITDTDDVYYLVINGRPYKALDLNLKESSNGEIGNIKVKILNNNF